MPEKHKKPPSFPHVHPSRARKFKKAWVEKAKITSKWRAQKKKEGLMEKAKLDIPEYESEERNDSDGLSPNTPDHSNNERSVHPTPSEDDVRDLTRKAYSKSNLHTFKSDPLKKRDRPKGEKGRGQPDMKLRMNALLAKIKRDYT